MIKRALIVDDHPIIRDALVTSLVALGVFESVETCSSFAETMQRLNHDSRYDLLILDLSLTDITGTNGMIQVREAYPEIPVIIFSGNDSVETIAEAFEWGVHGFVSKSAPVQVVVNAIELVLAGSIYIPPVAVQLMGYQVPETGLTSSQNLRETPHVHLSPKQREVFDQLMLGIPNKLIADRLRMAEGTVKTHLHSIYQVLRVRNRAQAILRARELNMIA